MNNYHDLWEEFGIALAVMLELKQELDKHSNAVLHGEWSGLDSDLSKSLRLIQELSETLAESSTDALSILEETQS